MVDAGGVGVLAVQTAGLPAPPEALGMAPVQPQVAIIDLAEVEVRALHEPRLSSLRIIADRDLSVGVDLPEGWLPLQGSEPGSRAVGVYAMNHADGSLLPLPAVGEFVVQG